MRIYKNQNKDVISCFVVGFQKINASLLADDMTAEALGHDDSEAGGVDMAGDDKKKAADAKQPVWKKPQKKKAGKKGSGSSGKPKTKSNKTKGAVSKTAANGPATGEEAQTVSAETFLLMITTTTTTTIIILTFIFKVTNIYINMNSLQFLSRKNSVTNTSQYISKESLR